MNTFMTTWRKHLFEVGRRYRVLESFKSATSAFVAGEILVFQSAEYSRYDSNTGFIFKTENGETKAVGLSDSAEDMSEQRFSPVD
jgi:hypothetical protein